MAPLKCALCGNIKELNQSHIIPKFVGRKLKNTGGTGYLRGIIDPGKRKQDLPKLPLLCNECEELFSRYETYFANTIFHPFYDHGVEIFKYDERLLKFLVSVNWRTLKISYDDFIAEFPFLVGKIDEAEKQWRCYLLDKPSDIDEYEHHIMLLDYVDESTEIIPDGYQWYTLRSCDATLVGNHDNVLAYSKFPWMLFTSSIYPKKLDGWEGTKVNKEGVLEKPQKMDPVFFKDFFVQRAEFAINEIDKVPEGKIIDYLMSDPERYLKSESFEVAIAEAKRRSIVKKEKLPDTVSCLIDIIENSIENPMYGEMMQRRLKFIQRVAADSLANLSEEEALALHEKLENIIIKSRKCNSEERMYFETDRFNALFMVNLAENKDEQKKALEKAHKELIEESDKGDTKIIIAFSFNPKLEDFLYETAYYSE